MSDNDTPVMVLLGELESLSDAHLVSSALEEAGILYRVARHDSHAFDIAMPHGWGMLYVDQDARDEAATVLAAVREDERLADDAEDDEDAPGTADDEEE